MLRIKCLHHLHDILVAAAAHVDDHDVALAMRLGVLHHERHRMRRLQRRDDSLDARAKLKCLQRFLVGRVRVLDASEVAQITMLRPNRRVIEPGAY